MLVQVWRIFIFLLL